MLIPLIARRIFVLSFIPVILISNNWLQPLVIFAEWKELLSPSEDFLFTFGVLPVYNERFLGFCTRTEFKRLIMR